ncbi:MAG TPA: deoxyribose-phosphate aldolase [bacterium]|nr:deoxyribose-phosphate aldolase [bacterium]
MISPQENHRLRERWSVPTVDQVAVTERAASFTKRSIKKASKVTGLRLALSMVDLTTLEGKDSPGKVRALCAKAVRPLPGDPTVPRVAAVCVYPNLVPVAVEALAGTGVKVASVATGFPSGQAPLGLKVEETAWVVDQGAHEVDMVINRGAFLAGRYDVVAEEIRAIKAACGPAHLKVILETGELETYDNVRLASAIAIRSGADFIKTSTGKVAVNATLPVTLVMLEAIRDHYHETGNRIGMKPAGGIATAKLALHYLVMVKETLGDGWLTPDLFRFGASSLANDLLMQLERERTGRYQGGDYFTKD